LEAMLAELKSPTLQDRQSDPEALGNDGCNAITWKGDVSELDPKGFLSQPPRDRPFSQVVGRARTGS
jgi:hypothetical protein